MLHKNSEIKKTTIPIKKNITNIYNHIHLSYRLKIFHNYIFNIIMYYRIHNYTYTSVLKRAIRTLWMALHEMDLMWIPIYKSWKLNERHYGALQGLNKEETIKLYGEEQVRQWRRSVNTYPPKLDIKDSRYPGFDIKYKDLEVNELPATENLVDTQKRVLSYWSEFVEPSIRSGKKVIIAAHGNTLRALVKYLDDVPDNGIVDLNIPTGTPLIYEFDDNLKPTKRCYLGLEGELSKECIPMDIPEE